MKSGTFHDIGPKYYRMNGGTTSAKIREEIEKSKFPVFSYSNSIKILTFSISCAVTI
jgi:hypothetical protein